MEVTEFVNKIEEAYSLWGYLLVFISSFIETSPLGFTIPGSLMVAVGGFFAYAGKVSFFGILLAGTAGMLTVFVFAYWLGKTLGEKLVKIFKQEKNAEKARVLLNKHGMAILTTSLLATFTRFWVAFIAGAQSYNFTRFLFYSTAVSFVWNLLLVMVGYFAGSGRVQMESGLARLGVFTWLLLIAAISVIYWANKKESRQAVGKNKAH
jgi:membrane protein DedA with SNARE-associated domain